MPTMWGSDRSSLCSLLQVKQTYSQGTYRAGAMRQVSLVGAVDEEVGDYFPEFISMLEESPFLEVSVFIMSVYINSPTASGCVNVSHFSLCMAVSHYVTLKCLTLCLCSGLCPGELSPVCGCRAPLRATMALSCGSDLENRWSLWQTCQNHPLKGNGGLTYWVCKCLPVQVLSSHQHLKKNVWSKVAKCFTTNGLQAPSSSPKKKNG